MNARYLSHEPIEPWMAVQIWQVLIEECGNRNDGRRLDLYSFCAYLEKDTGFGHEYRFMGALGFGGKFYNDHFSWRVGTYREDATPAKNEMIRRANVRLAELRRVYLELPPEVAHA
jgi:hypothetical protein